MVGPDQDAGGGLDPELAAKVRDINLNERMDKLGGLGFAAAADTGVEADEVFNDAGIAPLRSHLFEIQQELKAHTGRSCLHVFATMHTCDTSPWKLGRILPPPCYGPTF